MLYRFNQIAFNSTAKKKPTEEDKEHYIGLEHLDSDCLSVTRWGAEVAPIGEKLLMKKGDILFGKRRAYQRKVGIAPFDGIFSAHGMVLRPNEDIINKDFFPFFICSDQFMERAVRISVGGLSPTINWKDLREQEFELPPLSEQRILAEKLWSAYRLKESYKRLLVTTDEMVKSQFIEMFGKSKTNRKISDVAIVVSGKSIPKNLEDIEGDFAYIKVADFNLPVNNKNIVASSRYVTQDNARTSKCIPIGSTIFAKNGAAAMSNKKRITKVECCIDMNTMAVIPNQSIIPEFLYSVFESVDLSAFTRQGAVPSMSPHSVKNMELYLPDIEEQQMFVSIAEQADKSKFELRKSIEAIDQVIKSLINNQ